jgi:hypothetical protein
MNTPLTPSTSRYDGKHSKPTHPAHRARVAGRRPQTRGEPSSPRPKARLQVFRAGRPSPGATHADTKWSRHKASNSSQGLRFHCAGRRLCAGQCARPIPDQTRHSARVAVVAPKPTMPCFASFTKSIRSTRRAAVVVDIEFAKLTVTRLVTDIPPTPRLLLLTKIEPMHKPGDLPSLRSAFFATVSGHHGQSVAMMRLLALDARSKVEIAGARTDV